jgi:hypothetical protein
MAYAIGHKLVPTPEKAGPLAGAGDDFVGCWVAGSRVLWGKATREINLTQRHGVRRRSVEKREASPPLRRGQQRAGRFGGRDLTLIR